MMTWNYRVFKEDNGDYIIREVFYDEQGCIFACTQDAVEPSGDSLEGLAADLELFKQALTLPVLTLADIPAPKTEQRRAADGHTLSLQQVMAELELA